MRFYSIVALASGPVPVVHSQVVGEAFGMAVGTTGGGDATPAAPADITELTEWLTDDVARVILIDKEFDFTGTEGDATSAGCEMNSCTIAQGGQGFIGTLSCTGPGMTAISSITYDAAGNNPIRVGSNKSIVGVGSAGVLRGKGLRIQGSQNVIIQNIHITELNLEYVWGGDAITIGDADKPAMSPSLTASSTAPPLGLRRATESTTGLCSLIGSEDYYTFANNYLHDLSGRAPHYGIDTAGATNVFHAVNNLFENMNGHAFDIEPNTWSVIEGNVFDSVTTTVTSESYTRDNQIFIAMDGNGDACQSLLGRACVDNLLTSGSTLTSIQETEAITQLGTDGTDIAPAMSADQVSASVKANAGIGKLSSSSSGSGSSTGSSTTPLFAATPESSSASESTAVPESSVTPEANVDVESTPTTLVTAVGSAATEESSSSGASKWAQCGGSGWTGPTTCTEGTCTSMNEWFSQCV